MKRNVICRDCKHYCSNFGTSECWANAKMLTHKCWSPISGTYYASHRSGNVLDCLTKNAAGDCPDFRATWWAFWRWFR